MQRPLAGCAVAEEYDAHLVGPAHLGAQTDARGHRNVRADDAVCAEHALVDVRYVHGAALAAVGARGLAQQLGQHLVDVDALGDAVVMAAVSPEDEVIVAQVGADARGHRLLSDGRMHPSQLARVGLAAGLLFESADGDHRPVHPQQRIAIQRRVRRHRCPPNGCFKR